MQELRQGTHFLIAEETRLPEPQELIFGEVRKNGKKVSVSPEGVTDRELLSVMAKRLEHVYATFDHPDILSALRKVKEANFLLAPHFITPVEEYDKKE